MEYDRPDPALSLLRRSWLPVAMVLFGALVVLLIVGGVMQQLSTERNAILREAQQHTSNLARALQPAATRTTRRTSSYGNGRGGICCSRICRRRSNSSIATASSSATPKAPRR
jgi:hypothetical protein